jgi:flavin reductase (DIM6/NTAB) family NADH-FMN oxidoreductase RutF
MEMTDAEANKRQDLAAALGRVPSGLFILTARHGDAETGMLASWVQQCSFEPPRVSVAIRPTRDINAWLTPDSLFVLNVIEEGQKLLLGRFAKGFALSEPAFTGLPIEHQDGGPAILRDALAYLTCRVVQRVPAGDHDLLIGEVVGGEMLRESKPWVHIRKNGLNY